MHLYNKLSGIHFIGFEKVSFDALFSRLYITLECKGKCHSYWLLLLRFLYHIIWDYNYSLETKFEDKNHILFFKGDRIRESDVVNFKKAISTTIGDYIIIDWRGKKLHLLQTLELIFYYVPLWILPLLKNRVAVKDSLHIITNLIILWRINIQLTNINFNKYNLLCVFYDSIPLENYLVQVFQRKGITTATLQHGQFNAWKENSPLNCGLELRSSVADYFLCWNQFTKDEAIKAGMTTNKIKMVGILSNIGKKRQFCKIPQNNIFGIVCSHPTWENENVEMIKAANLLSHYTNKHYVIKLHPNYSNDYFDKIIDHSYFDGIVEKGIDLLAYANSVEFSIIGSSSVFEELTFFSHKMIRYSSGLPSDKYLNVNIGKYFRNPQDIIAEYSKENHVIDSDTFDYLCTVNNVDENYREFFSNYL